MPSGEGGRRWHTMARVPVGSSVPIAHPSDWEDCSSSQHGKIVLNSKIARSKMDGGVAQ